MKEFIDKFAEKVMTTKESFDVKRGFKVSEILDKTIDATVDKYIYRGYEGTTLIDFR